MSMHGKVQTARSILILSIAALTSLAFLPACAIYANYPAIEGDVAVNDPNVSPMPQVMISSLKKVISTYPVEGEFVVNLPEGMTKDKAEWVVGALGDADAFLVDSLDESRPVYHVSRIWIRGDRGTVDVLRPVPGVGEGDVAYQRATCKLLRRGQWWRVESLQTGVIGAADPPRLFGWPATDAPDAPSSPSDD